MTVHPDGVRLELASGGSSNTGVSGVSGVSARLVLDCMGHASPVVRQARWGTKPDGKGAAYCMGHCSNADQA
jgi:lycopene cyclase CruP